MTDFVKKLQILNASCIILSTASLNDYQIINNSSLFLVYPCFCIFLSAAGRTQQTLSYRLFKVGSLWQQRHNRTRYGGQRRFADTVFLRHAVEPFREWNWKCQGVRSYFTFLVEDRYWTNFVVCRSHRVYSCHIRSCSLIFIKSDTSACLLSLKLLYSE